jgi:hypothetical protein
VKPVAQAQVRRRKSRGLWGGRGGGEKLERVKVVRVLAAGCSKGVRRSCVGEVGERERKTKRRSAGSGTGRLRRRRLPMRRPLYGWVEACCAVKFCRRVELK